MLQAIIDKAARAVDSAVSQVGVSSSSTMGRVFVTLLSVAIIQWAYQIYKGQENIDPLELGKRLAKFIVIAIAALSFSTPRYGFSLATWVTDLPADMGSVAGINTNPASIIDGTLEKTIANVESLFMMAVENAVLNPMGIVYVLMGAIVGLIGCIVCGGAFAMYLFAKISLGLAVIAGPLALICLLLPATEKWFHSWVSYTVSSGVVFLANAFVLGIVFSLLGLAADFLVPASTVTETGLPGVAPGDVITTLPGNGSVEYQVHHPASIGLRDLFVFLICYSVGAFSVFKAEQMAFALAGSSGASAAGYTTMLLGGATTVIRSSMGVAGTSINAASGFADARKSNINPNNTSLAYRTGALLGGIHRQSSAGKGGESGGTISSQGANSGRQNTGQRPTSGRFKQ